MKRAVYVTGLGAVCCVGAGVDALWGALLEGRCGLREITRFGLEGSPYTVAGEVEGFDVRATAECGLSVGAQFAATACEEALGSFPSELRGSLAVLLSTNFGPAEVLEGWLEGAETPGSHVERGPFMADARRVADALGAGGPVGNISLSCASGNAAAACALDLIRARRAEAALACGYDSIQRMSWAGLCALRVMALAAEGMPAAVRPFDLERAGTIFSEGAGCLLLESAESVERRGAEPLAEAAGAAANNNAYHLTHADREGEGTAVAIRMALEDAGVAADEVDHISAHGTGTALNDAIESRAFLSVFGERAGRIPVVSLKGGLGHAMGAASLLEAVAAVRTLREGVIPPTVNHRTPDPDCPLDVVHGAPRELEVTTVLNNSAGIGGSNAAVVLRRSRGG